MRLYQSQFLSTENASLDCGVYINNLPIFTSMGFKNYNLIFLIMSKFWIGTNTMCQCLTHTLV